MKIKSNQRQLKEKLIRHEKKENKMYKKLEKENKKFEKEIK